jgi:diacylglycerol kinase
MRTDPIARSRGKATRRHDPAVPRTDAIAATPAAPAQAPPDPFGHLLPDPAASPESAAQADRKNVRGKLAAGWRGLKAAFRGDSSFFAHLYRGALIVIAAALLGLNLWGWCLVVLGASLVLIAELAHSAVDTLARAIGDPEEPRLKTAREIAAAGVLVAAFGSGAVTLIVLSVRFLDLMGWRL